MKAHELFRGMTDAFASSVLQYFRDENRDVYRTTIASLAAARKLRPVYIQRKPAVEQVAWLIKTLRLRSSDEVAEQLLQVWLLKARQPMLVQFLDDLGIAHDEEGSVDDLPESLDPDKLRTAVDNLLAAFPAPEVSVYLHMFQRQTAEGWPELAEILASDPRLQLAEKSEQ
jgi:hypothetical protein